MIENIIEQIKEAEEKAKEIMQETKKQHTDIVEKAYESREKMILEADTKAHEIMQTAESKAREDALREVKELTKEKEKQIENIRSLVLSKEQEAINIIIKEVLA